MPGGRKKRLGVAETPGAEPDVYEGFLDLPVGRRPDVGRRKLHVTPSYMSRHAHVEKLSVVVSAQVFDLPIPVGKTQAGVVVQPIAILKEVGRDDLEESLAHLPYSDYSPARVVEGLRVDLAPSIRVTERNSEVHHLREFNQIGRLEPDRDAVECLPIYPITRQHDLQDFLAGDAARAIALAGATSPLDVALGLGTEPLHLGLVDSNRHGREGHIELSSNPKICSL